MPILLVALCALLAYMSALFVIALIARNNGVADIGYGGAFMVVIGTTAFLAPPASPLIAILTALPFIWGIRLVIRIFRKNLGKPEDFRYKAWRDAWGERFVVRSFFQIYMLQGLVAFVVALPVLLALVYPAAPHLEVVIAGLCFWAVGFYFEAVGDHQLDTFVRNPENKGKILMSGLWEYSRHPNYFGESMMWWSIALASSGLTSIPIIGFFSPMLITYLLLRVSGVPLLEARWAGNPEWEKYKKRTSVFFPMVPRR